MKPPMLIPPEYDPHTCREQETHQVWEAQSKNQLPFIPLGWRIDKLLLKDWPTAAQLLQSCLTLCDPMDFSPPAFSTHVILHVKILEWLAMPSSREGLTYYHVIWLTAVPHLGIYVLCFKFTVSVAMSLENINKLRRENWEI